MSGNRSNIDLVGNTTQVQNLGTGEGLIFKQKVSGNILQLRSLKEGANIKIIQDGDDIIISGATGTGGGDVNSVNTGVGLSGDTTTGDVTIRLDNTAVTPATYGNATCVAQFTVDQQGRITSASNVEITGSGGGSTTFTGLTDTPANYTGSANCYVSVNAGATGLEFVNPPTGAPAGVDGSIQYNNNGTFSGATMFYDNSTETFILGTEGTGAASSDVYFRYQNDGCYVTDSFCFTDLGFWDGFTYRSFMLIGVEERQGFICTGISGEDITIKSGGNYSINLCGGSSVNISGTFADINTTCLGFYGTSPKVKPTVTGSRDGNAALASLLTALDNLGLITDNTSV